MRLPARERARRWSWCPAPGSTRLRAIVRRDLDFSDRFEMISAGDAPPTAPAERRRRRPVNYGIYKNLGRAVRASSWSRRRAASRARLHDVTPVKVRQRADGRRCRHATDPAFRMDAAPAVATRSSAGRPARRAWPPRRFLFVSDGRVYRIDSDGARSLPLYAGGPDRALAGLVAGRRSASRTPGSRAGAGRWCCSRSRAARAQDAPGAGAALNITPAFSPDGRHARLRAARTRAAPIFTRANVGGTLLRATLDRGTLSLTTCHQPFRQTADASRSSPRARGRRRSTSWPRTAPIRSCWRRSTTAPPAARTRPSGRRTGPTSSSTARSRGSPQLFLVDVAGRRVRQLTVVRPQRGSDLGSRRTARRLRLRPQRTAADLDHRHRNRPGAAAPDPGRRAASRVVPAPGRYHGHLATHELGVMMRASSLIAPRPPPRSPPPAAARSRPRSRRPSPRPAPAAPPPAPAPVDSSAERERLRARGGGRARPPSAPGRSTADLATMINFEYDKADIRSADQGTLDRKARHPRGQPERARSGSAATPTSAAPTSTTSPWATGARRRPSATSRARASTPAGSRSCPTARSGRCNPGTDEAAYAQNRRDEFEVTAGGDNLVAPAVRPRSRALAGALAPLLLAGGARGVRHQGRCADGAGRGRAAQGRDGPPATRPAPRS